MRHLVRAVISLFVLLATPTVAAASSVGLTPPGEIVAEIGFAVAVVGIAAPGDTLHVGYADAADGCAGPRVDAVLITGQPVEGPFRQEARTTFEEPGGYVLCATVLNESRDVAAQIAVPVAVRPSRAALTIAAAPVVALGQGLAITVTGSAEVPRAVQTTLARPGASCAAKDLFVELTNVAAGPFVQRGTQKPDRFGTWRICVEVKREFTSFSVHDQRFERTVRVSVSCTRAARRLSRARDRWRSRSRALALAGRPPDARLRRLGRAIRRARSRLEPACRPGLR